MKMLILFILFFQIIDSSSGNQCYFVAIYEIFYSAPKAST